jgi:uncharacterized protein YoxC
MSNALQVALFAACVAVVLFVLMLIPLSLLLYRSVRRTAEQMEEMKTDLKLLIQDLRVTVQNINLLSARANQQLDDLGQIVRVVQGWSTRANHVVEEVSSAVEAPFIMLMRGVSKLRQIWRFMLGDFTDNDGRAAPQTKEGSQAEKNRAPAPQSANNATAE